MLLSQCTKEQKMFYKELMHTKADFFKNKKYSKTCNIVK